MIVNSIQSRPNRSQIQFKSATMKRSPVPLMTGSIIKELNVLASRAGEFQLNDSSTPHKLCFDSRKLLDNTQQPLEKVVLYNKMIKIKNHSQDPSVGYTPHQVIETTNNYTGTTIEFRSPIQGKIDEERTHFEATWNAFTNTITDPAQRARLGLPTL